MTRLTVDAGSDLETLRWRVSIYHHSNLATVNDEVVLPMFRE